MKVNILASGSSGNCIALTAGKYTILVDAGIAKTKIEKRLLEVGITPNQVQAIFITHAHKDHTKGLPLANKYKIPVFAAEEEWKSIEGVDQENKFNFTSGKQVIFGEYKVQSFKTHHDAYDPVGYAITVANKKCSICLDTGKVDQEMLEVMKDSDIYIIESNHEPKMVEVSYYPNSVKARILSDIGHLSNMQTTEALAKLLKGKNEEVYLTHLSSHNNMPALAELTMKRYLLKKGFKEDEHYQLEVIT